MVRWAQFLHYQQQVLLTYHLALYTVVNDDGGVAVACSCMEVLSEKRWSYRKDGRISRVNSTAVISNLQGWLIMLH